MSLKITEETTFLLDMVNQTYGPELHTDANAASDPNGNEADAITGWTPTGLTGTGANVFESQGAVKNVGSYALHADCNDTPTLNAQFAQDFTIDDGATYNVKFDWRHVGVGNDWAFRSESITKVTIASTQTSFESVDMNVVGAGIALAIEFRESGGGNSGGIYMDNFSIRKVL